MPLFHNHKLTATAKLYTPKVHARGWLVGYVTIKLPPFLVSIFNSENSMPTNF